MKKKSTISPTEVTEVIKVNLRNITWTKDRYYVGFWLINIDTNNNKKLFLSIFVIVKGKWTIYWKILPRQSDL